MTSVQQQQKNEEVGPSQDDENTLFSIFMIFCIFTVAFMGMTFLFLKSPKLSAEDAMKIKLPKNLDDAKELGRVISNYKDDYFIQVIVAFVLTYIFLQSFAIPGSIFLSILSGFLFPFPLALFLVCLCSATGASFCYLLSSVIGKKVVKRFFPERINKWKKQVENHEKDYWVISCFYV